MAHIAFLGLGRMGANMARRLLAAGHTVTVWNRTKSKAEVVLAAGARWAATPAEAVVRVEAAFAMLADDTASRQVWLGSDGALGRLSRGAFVIECSTLSHAFVLELADASKARGLRYLDCPVTGWPSMAASGDLTLLMGADGADLEAAHPLLEPLCKAIRVFGPVGAGTGYKLMINLMGSVQIAALAEGLALARRLGLDTEAVIAAVESGAAASPQVVKHCRPMAKQEFAAEPAFTAALRFKDASYGLALARASGSAAPIGAAATAWWDKTRAVDPDADEACIVEIIARS